MTSVHVGAFGVRSHRPLLDRGRLAARLQGRGFLVVPLLGRGRLVLSLLDFGVRGRKNPARANLIGNIARHHRYRHDPAGRGRSRAPLGENPQGLRRGPLSGLPRLEIGSSANKHA